MSWLKIKAFIINITEKLDLKNFERTIEINSYSECPFEKND